MAKSIVIAEDFNTTRNIIKTTLEKKGYSILEAVDGRDALQYFDGRVIDLLITDYNMPNMDGATLIETIREMQKYEYIPILVLSTEINQEKKERAFSSKITGWIKKPFEISEFTKMIEKIVR